MEIEKEKFIAKYLQTIAGRCKTIAIDCENNGNTDEENMEFTLSTIQTFHVAEILWEMKKQTKLLENIKLTMKQEG